MSSESGGNETQGKPSTLFIGTDLPYFPGKMGVDFFNLRHLARSHRVSVVGPCYEALPVEGVNNLRKTADACYLWPESVARSQVTTEPIARRALRYPLTLLSRAVLRRIWAQIMSVDKRPKDAFQHLRILSNLAPYLIAALRGQKPSTIVLLQSASEPWLQFLPKFAAKFVYFHDVRADFEEKRQRLRESTRDNRIIKVMKLQEKSLLESVDAAAFVSERDLQIARRLYSPEIPLLVAPIPIDTEYYRLPTSTVKRPVRPLVLFTGHLSHPPNVDAVIYFLEEIWPKVREWVPTAQFSVAGAFPDPKLIEVVERTDQATLHRNVPDIRPYFEEATVYVVPMRFGGGVRQKILEAWSMKRPVVATSMAVEGIEVKHGRELWIEDTPEIFACRIAEILDGRLATEDMVERCRKLVEKHYAIDVTASRFANAVNATRRRIGQRPFKVLFDLRWMKIGYAGGIEQLVYELASSISKLDPTNAYRFYGPRSTLLDWRFPASFQHSFSFSDPIAQRIRDFRFELTDALGEASKGGRLLNREMRFLKFVKDLDFDLVHSFQGFTYPEFHGFPSVLTFPDLQHLAYPEFFPKEAFDTRENLFRASVKYADHVICISQFTLEDLHKKYEVPREKMSVVWVTPSASCRISLEEQECKCILHQLGIDFRFLFYPAHNWPHKNHLRLLEALSRVRDDLPSDIRLVLTGGTADARTDLAALVAKMGLEGKVRHLGYVTPLQVAALYRKAHALIFPSLFEGFGIPVAEAILNLCPIACSNSTSLPEIAGDAALLFDPSSVASIATAISEISTNEDLRGQLRERAAARRPLFAGWTPAIKTMEIYHRIFRERFS
jgi:glycosyltransferase involved in cell wall biosynthesis